MSFLQDQRNIYTYSLLKIDLLDVKHCFENDLQMNNLNVNFVGRRRSSSSLRNEDQVPVHDRQNVRVHLPASELRLHRRLLLRRLSVRLHQTVRCAIDDDGSRQGEAGDGGRMRLNAQLEN